MSFKKPKKYQALHISSTPLKKIKKRWHDGTDFVFISAFMNNIDFNDGSVGTRLAAKNKNPLDKMTRQTDNGFDTTGLHGVLPHSQPGLKRADQDQRLFLRVTEALGGGLLRGVALRYFFCCFFASFLKYSVYLTTSPSLLDRVVSDYIPFSLKSNGEAKM